MATVSLLVGGIGSVNFPPVSVTEWARVAGIRPRPRPPPSARLDPIETLRHE